MISPIKLQCISVIRATALHNRSDLEGKTREFETIEFAATRPIHSMLGPSEEKPGPKSEVVNNLILRAEGDQMGHFKADKFYDLTFKET